MFLLFQNDFPENTIHGECITYADNTTDNVSDETPEGLGHKLQEKANLSTQWVKDNQMFCSGEKTKLLIVSTKELRESKLTSKGKQITVNVNGKEIKESQNEKLLGMVIQNEFKFNT